MLPAVGATAARLLAARCGQRSASALLLQSAPRRSMAALENWKRPTLDEMGVPEEAWSQDFARRNARYNIYLAVGIAFFSFTMFFGYSTNCFFLNLTPYHLIDGHPRNPNTKK